VADSAASGVTRRRLLAGAVGGIGGLAVFGLFPVLESLAAKVLGASELNQATFARLVGTAFRVSTAPGRAAAIKLLSVRPLTAHGTTPTGEGFSLIFSGSRSDVFGQDNYTVDHSKLGTFAMFIVPVGLPGSDQRYEAVFNRLWK
jgi:uncharacterized protein DUF6916